MLGKLLLVEIEVDDKAETIPFELVRWTLAVSEQPDRVTDCPRSREGGRELSKRVDVLTGDLRGSFPVIEGEPESNLLLESDVADKNGPVESGRPGSRKRHSLYVDVGVGVGGVGELSRLIGIEGGR